MRNTAKHRRGTVLTEYALTFPIVMLFFFASFEFCRFSMLSHTVDNAVYEAARRGIIPGATTAQLDAEARQILGTLGVRDATIDVAPAAIDESTPAVTVTVSVPFDANSFAPTRFLRGSTVRRTLTMRREQNR